MCRARLPPRRPPRTCAPPVLLSLTPRDPRRRPTWQSAKPPSSRARLPASATRRCAAGGRPIVGARSLRPRRRTPRVRTPPDSGDAFPETRLPPVLPRRLARSLLTGGCNAASYKAGLLGGAASALGSRDITTSTESSPLSYSPPLPHPRIHPSIHPSVRPSVTS
jgi:hypothetical protein